MRLRFTTKAASAGFSAAKSNQAASIMASDSNAVG
jgi:hypothetical protein